MAIAELVSTLDISPLPARLMKMTPSTASRIGAILVAMNSTTPSVLMRPVGLGGGLGGEEAVRDVADGVNHWLASQSGREL